MFIIIISALYHPKLCGQISVNAGGNSASENDISIAYSIGQTFVNSFSDHNNAYLATEGVQYPEEISIPNIILSSNSRQNEVSLYPNPVIDVLNVSIKGIQLKQAKLLIYDLTGKLTSVYQIKDELSSFDTSEMVSGTYIASLLNNNVQLVFIKFIKI